MKKLLLSAALIAALSAPLSVSAAEYQCADGTILKTGTQVQYSFVKDGVLTEGEKTLEAKTPLVIWQKSECRLRTANGLQEAFEYAEKVGAYKTLFGAWTLEQLFPERFGK